MSEINTHNNSQDKQDLCLNFNINTVISQIEKNKVFKSGATEIYYNSNQSKEDLKADYKGKICIDDKLLYMGTLSNQLLRSGLGINFYKNGDVYLGNWNDDKRSDIGLYIYRSNNVISEAFYGNWENGKKNGFGVYVWKKGGLKDIIIGEFKDDSINNGLYIIGVSSKNPPKSIYYGKFNINGEKEGEEANFYSSKSENVFLGKMIKGEFANGTIYFKSTDTYYNININEKEEDMYIPETDQVEDEIKRKIKKFHSKVNKKFDNSTVAGLCEKLVENISNEIIKIKEVEQLESINLKEIDYLKKCESILDEISLDSTKTNLPVKMKSTKANAEKDKVKKQAKF